MNKSKQFFKSLWKKVISNFGIKMLALGFAVLLFIILRIV